MLKSVDWLIMVIYQWLVDVLAAAYLLTSSIVPPTHIFHVFHWADFWCLVLLVLLNALFRRESTQCVRTLWLLHNRLTVGSIPSISAIGTSSIVDSFGV